MEVNDLNHLFLWFKFIFIALPEFCSFFLKILLIFHHDLISIHEVGHLEEHFEDLNSIIEVGQLEEQTEFLCNVDEEYVPKVGMPFKSCTEAMNSTRSMLNKLDSQKNKETNAIGRAKFCSF
ncbi:hypothetical protein PIB30_009680 [Stylosanthes scabra]|uniref:Uncharacterized protein n=1 Tax=Stylosanthes scabra TaxID=79078 RepID=A0ABU6U5H9_9FABA|nr:hypothetical protein [Stylosanthes scabra]